MLRKQGQEVAAATSFLSGTSVGEKNELLFQNGINFNELPNWQKRGVGLHWEEYQKNSVNPQNGAGVNATRRRIKVDYELPMKDEYSEFVLNLLK